MVFINFSIFIIFLLLTGTQSIYFLIPQGTYKCFYEEFYKDSIIAFRYQTLEEFHEEQEHEHTPIFNFILSTVDNARQVDTMQGINPSGRVNFIIEETAPYSICIFPNTNSQVFEHQDVVKISITLELIDNTAEEIDLSNVPKNKDFEKINTRMDKLHKKIVDIMKTQNYQIYKEDEFSRGQIENSSTIVYITVIQIGILLALTIWQISSFKNLFKEQLNI